ncbi:MAG: PHP domain-containing protein [candidate division Zixibacteria bacterium]|nr:PHP domain-containing protein [candidate division Zixibacteria bacterium]
MSERLIDLHLHTRHSDGSCSPEETVHHARQLGLSALSITDHDSLSAIDEARQFAEGIELITGVELSCHYQDADIHLLAYFIDPAYAPLADKVKFYQLERLKRGILIVEKLNELGIDLKMETVQRMAKDATLGRVHVADALLKEEYVHTFDEAFSRYLGYHAPAYVPKTHFDPAEAIELVHQAGGISVMAHPGSTRRDDAIAFMKGVGMDGLEVYHSKHTPAQVRHYKEMAARNSLLISGGSDWHGRNDPRSEMGNQRVPYGVLARMKDFIQARNK